MPQGRRPEAAPSRVVIENVRPQVDCGRFPVKAILGDRLIVTADIFAEGHDVIHAVVLYRRASEPEWREVPMEPLPNDAWRAGFPIESLEPYRFTVEAWVDPLRTWRRDLEKRVAADAATPIDLRIGAELVAEAARRAQGPDARPLSDWARDLDRAAREPGVQSFEVGLSPEIADKWSDRSSGTRYARELEVNVDREKARFSAWYEMFPRSASPDPRRPGTLKDCLARLPYVAEMGFDVLYLPPIHPIGRTYRKGKNNSPTPEPGDVGSPWAIGSSEGGHTAVHPELGTLDDFRCLLAQARERGIEVALDIAFQCSPDHPWVREHPEWFRRRPDGTIQYAENPPKKYQDIYPLHFENEDWKGLWEELKGVFLYWVDQGVRIFRVDNPHTKPFGFWEWVIAEVRREHPEVIFLSEAFTRPKVMYQLAKLGFSQSYTYFAWRNTQEELTRYLTELTSSPVSDFFRPNFWPNTPDILTESLQFGGRGVFAARLVLAATFGASYGIYGPPFELQEHRPREPGSEEYLHSEKYEVRHWALDRADSLKDLIARVNRIRRENPALARNDSLAFHPVDNDQLIAYSKVTEDRANQVLTVVNLDPHHAHAGWLTVPLERFGLDPHQSYQVHDLLTGARFLWQGSRNYVSLDPRGIPAHVFRLRKRLRSERDFDYYL